MKKTPLKRKTPLRAPKPWMVPKKPKNALKRQIGGNKKKPRARLPSLKSLRNKCDALLTPIAKKKSPHCEACGSQTQVGHHWIEKSRSSNLRYDLRNIIALCHTCHAHIHNRFGSSIVGSFDVAYVIIQKRGFDWKEAMETEGRIMVKVDRFWYETHYARLQGIYDSATDV